MTINELIKALEECAADYGGDTPVVLGAGFDEDDRLEYLSLQVEPRDGGNDLVFEEKFTGYMEEP